MRLSIAFRLETSRLPTSSMLGDSLTAWHREDEIACRRPGFGSTAGSPDLAWSRQGARGTLPRHRAMALQTIEVSRLRQWISMLLSHAGVTEADAQLIAAVRSEAALRDPLGFDAFAARSLAHVV